MDKMALYHAYIEDDSFLCTENLLHQVTILKNIPEGQRGLPIRTGMQVKKWLIKANYLIKVNIIIYYDALHNVYHSNCHLF